MRSKRQKIVVKTTSKQKRQNSIVLLKKNSILLLKMMVFYILIIFTTEAVFRKSIIDTLGWIIDAPFFFALNFFTLLAISSVLLIFTKRIVWVTIIVGFMASILSFINIGKFGLRNVPLLFDDLFLFNEVWVLLPQILNAKTIVLLILGIVFALGLAYYLFVLFKKNNLQKHRITVVLLFVLSMSILSIGQNINSADIDISKTGFIYSLSNNTRAQVIMDKDQLEAAGDLYNQFIEDNNNASQEGDATIKPNVIVIQSEAFWDVNKLGVSMDKNPIPNFEALRKESRYGELYVPVVGGGTANTEYEILTGMTLKNYSNDWYTVYPIEIKSPTVSMASILKNQGYETMGIHPYMSWYYNRLEVYKNLGFDTFKTIEFMNDVDLVGAFASDRYTTDLIIDAIEKTDKPLFNFTVTMQNHGPYENERFKADEFDINIQTQLKNTTRYILSNYVQGISISDKELLRLVEYLKQSDEPTILVFFGDHLPMLGEDYKTYREVGYVGDENNYTLQNDLRMMTIPYIIWSNVDDTSRQMPTMNASFITSVILEEAKAEMPDYLKVLADARIKMPLYFREFGIDANGNKVSKESELFLNTKALYVTIFDKLKDTDALSEWLVVDNENYNKSLSEIEINQIAINGASTKVIGNNFYQGMKLSIGSTEIEFKFINDTEIQVNQVLNSGDTVKATLFDSEGKLLAESNGYEIP